MTDEGQTQLWREEIARVQEHVTELIAQLQATEKRVASLGADELLPDVSAEALPPAIARFTELLKKDGAIKKAWLQQGEAGIRTSVDRCKLWQELPETLRAEARAADAERWQKLEADVERLSTQIAAEHQNLSEQMEERHNTLSGQLDGESRRIHQKIEEQRTWTDAASQQIQETCSQLQQGDRQAQEQRLAHLEAGVAALAEQMRAECAALRKKNDEKDAWFAELRRIVADPSHDKQHQAGKAAVESISPSVINAMRDDVYHVMQMSVATTNHFLDFYKQVKRLMTSYDAEMPSTQA